MANAALGVGTSANDGTGDDLRSGAIKINANFDEIYTELGNGTTLASASTTQTLTNKTLTAPTITGAGAIAGVFTGNITGNVTGNVSGNVTGNLDGIVGGNTPAAVTGTTISGTSITVTGTAGAVTLSTLTTAQRDALSAVNGMLVYNSTTTKIEAYANGAWVALH